jgi:hypothetical protein
MRAALVFIFLIFGYQKWFAYEWIVKGVIPEKSLVVLYLLRQDVSRLTASSTAMTRPMQAIAGESR